jgi:hypothetical protein
MVCWKKDARFRIYPYLCIGSILGGAEGVKSIFIAPFPKNFGGGPDFGLRGIHFFFREDTPFPVTCMNRSKMGGLLPKFSSRSQQKRSPKIWPPRAPHLISIWWVAGGSTRKSGPRPFFCRRAHKKQAKSPAESHDLWIVRYENNIFELKSSRRSIKLQ